MIKKIYQLIAVTPEDNWFEIGWTTDLTNKDFREAIRDWMIGELRTSIECNDIFIYAKDQNQLCVDDVDQWLIQNIHIPEDFITEYLSTFCTCIDKPCIDIEEINEKCLNPEFKLVDDGGWFSLCLRGFVHEFPEEIIDLMEIDVCL